MFYHAPITHQCKNKMNRTLLDLDTLAVLANVFQVLNYMENIEQSSNDKIMEELQRQNKEYLETIVKQNELIIKLLGGAESGLKQN